MLLVASFPKLLRTKVYNIPQINRGGVIKDVNITPKSSAAYVIEKMSSNQEMKFRILLYAYIALLRNESEGDNVTVSSANLASTTSFSEKICHLLFLTI